MSTDLVLADDSAVVDRPYGVDRRVLRRFAGKVVLADQLLDQFYVAPGILGTREGVRSLHLERGRMHVDLSTRLGKVAHGMSYEVAIEEVGKMPMPGVGFRRAYSVLTCGDMGRNPHFLVWYPGFAHDLTSKSAKWEMSLQAQVARALGVNVLCINPVGRGVPGFATATGVGNISAQAMIDDTLHVTRTVIDGLLHRAGVLRNREVDVIVTGHSLGARLARAFAHHIATTQSRMVLRGIVQEAPVGAGTAEDLLYLKHWQAIWRHLPEALGRAIFPSQGMEFKVKDLVKMFFGENCSDMDAALAAWSLVPGEARNFVDLSLRPGDLEEFCETMQLAKDTMFETVRGVGSKIIFPTQDQVFHRGPVAGSDPQDQMWQATHHLGTEAVSLHAPHCYFTPAPSDCQKMEVRNALMAAYQLGDLRVNGFGADIDAESLRQYPVDMVS